MPKKTHVLITQIVRSDGDILTPKEMPFPAGTPEEDRIIALEDGTIITSIPRPEDYATWRTESINAYIARVRDNEDPHRPFGEIMDDLLNHLRTTTWLPHEPDYALMAAYVAMSYVYNAFEAIPMMLMNGEKGSGKSTTAEAIADLSYNGHVLGAGSEKAMIRFVDMGRGLLVLDDLEKVGQRRGRQGAAEFNDINQILKVSYNKKTGVKTIVDSNGNNQRLVFYGPKVITNISGLDPVNESRTYTIHCRPMPLDVALSGRIKGHIPIRPGPFDINAAAGAVEIMNQAGRPGILVLSQVAAVGPDGDDTAAVLQELYPEVPVARARLGQRKAFMKALISGQAITEFDRPSSKAVTEIKALFREVRGSIKAS